MSALQRDIICHPRPYLSSLYISFLSLIQPSKVPASLQGEHRKKGPTYLSSFSTCGIHTLRIGYQKNEEKDQHFGVNPEIPYRVTALAPFLLFNILIWALAKLRVYPSDPSSLASLEYRHVLPCLVDWVSNK